MTLNIAVAATTTESARTSVIRQAQAEGHTFITTRFVETVMKAMMPGGGKDSDQAAQQTFEPLDWSGEARALVDAVHREVSEVLGISGQPVLAKTHSWPRGLPHYTLGHAGRCKIIKQAAARVPGLYLTGNFIDGVSMANCMASAQTVAEHLQRSLSNEPPCLSSDEMEQLGTVRQMRTGLSLPHKA